MTIQWMLVATFLYCEIGFIALLLTPFISPRMWKKLFDSKFIKALASKANIYFSVFIAILVLFFLDSIREMRKYSIGLAEHEHTHLDAEIQLNMKLFRSQRNFYIAGFALFLWLVIRKLIILILNQAMLCSQVEESMTVALKATDSAEKLLKEKEEILKSSKEALLEEELSCLQADLKKKSEEIKHKECDLKAMKEQATSVSREYDNLLNEHSELQQKYDSLVGAGDKKHE